MTKINTIWFVNKYAMPPQYESRLRTIKFAHYLQEMGYKVTIFGSSVMHNMDMDLIKDSSDYIEKTYGDLNFVHIKTMNYKKTAGIKRIISDIQFHYRFVKLAERFGKPDLIIATSYAIVTNPVLNYAKKKNIRYITEMLDAWPDDFVHYGLVSSWNPIMKLLYRVALRNYEESDATVFSFNGYPQYFEKKRWDKLHGGTVDMKRIFYINNGVDLHDFNAWNNKYTLDDEDLKSDKKHIIYLGSIRLVNNVSQLIKAAELLRNTQDVDFIIYGDGEDREQLIHYCEERKLGNVKFKDKWIDPKYVPFVLCSSYLNILNYISSDFAKYGISSSKMFQYMASGKPIVCNIDILNCPITDYHLGIAHEMKSAQDYADAIKQILDLPEEEYKAMCLRAKEVAKEFDYPYLTKQMVNIIKWIEEQ